MRTDFAFDIMAKINPDVYDILHDQQITTLKDGLKAGSLGAFDALRVLVDAMSSGKKQNVYNIIAALRDITPEEAQALDLSETVRTWSENMPELMRFFTALLSTVVRA